MKLRCQLNIRIIFVELLKNNLVFATTDIVVPFFLSTAIGIS